jgi:hypothetical protein
MWKNNIKMGHKEIVRVNVHSYGLAYDSVQW